MARAAEIEEEGAHCKGFRNLPLLVDFLNKGSQFASLLALPSCCLHSP